MQSVRSLRAQAALSILSGPRGPLLAALLAMLLTLPALGLGFVQDDLSLYTLAVRWPGDPLGPRAPWDLFRFYGDTALVQRMREAGLAPWWTTDELRLAFFRPLSSLWHWLDFRLLGPTPWAHHLGSILAYGASVLAVGFALRRLEEPRVAGLATLLWAIDDAHGMPVGWLANRNAVLAWALGALALGLHDRWRRDGWGPGALVAPAVAALALGAGETALGAWAYLLGYALFLDRGTTASRLGSLVPYGLVFVAWRVIYRLGGYGTAGSSFYVDPGSDPGAFLAVLPERLTVLLSAQLGLLPADLLLVLPASGRGPYLAVALATVGAALALLWPWRGDARVRFWAFGMAVAAVPVCATWPSERLLGFTGMGAFALVARGLLGSGPSWLKAALLAVHVGLAALLLPLRAMAVAVPDGMQRAVAETMPEAAGRELVVVAAPDWFVPTFGGVHRWVQGHPPPRALRILVTTPERFEIERLDERTLVLSHPRGFLRDPLAKVPRDRPLQPGEQRVVGGWSISVLQTDGEGHPTRLSFAAPTALEDPERIWTTWSAEGLVPFELPEAPP